MILRLARTTFSLPFLGREYVNYIQYWEVSYFGQIAKCDRVPNLRF
jgi:hypothetical protein